MIHLSPDAAQVVQRMSEWTTLEDLQRTMIRQDRDWTPARVAVAFCEAKDRGHLEAAGAVPVERWRAVVRRPGEVDPPERQPVQP